MDDDQGSGSFDSGLNSAQEPVRHLRVPASGDRACDAAATPFFNYEALDYGPDLIGVIGADGAYGYFNAAWRHHAARDGGRFASADWISCVHEADRPEVRRMLADAMATGVGSRTDLRLSGSEGDDHWFMLRAHPHHDETGHVRFWLYVLTDVHERKLHKLGLAQKAKMQTDMLNVSPDCIKLINPDGRLAHMNRAGQIALAVDEESGFGMDWLNLLPTEVHEGGRAALDQARRGSPASFPGMSHLPGEDIRYWDNMLTPLPNEDGDIESILCVSRDVTIRRRNERRIELLLNELNHRSRNMLAIIQSLIRHTVPDPDAAFVETLERRIRAMAQSQDLLVKGPHSGMTVRALVHSQTVVTGSAAEKRIVLHGDATLRLRPEAAEMIGLAMYELTTNAIKYGALSNDAGIVTIRWTVEDGDGSRLFHLDWEETGGPPVAPARKPGFGTTLIGRNPFAHLGGAVTHRFDAAGARWSFDAPADIVLAGADEA